MQRILWKFNLLGLWCAGYWHSDSFWGSYFSYGLALYLGRFSFVLRRL